MLGAPEGPLFWGAECKFEKAEAGGSFHQCVYLRCQQTPALMKAAELTRERLGIEQGAYMPHLSVVYGDLAPEAREAEAGKLGGLLAELDEGFTAAAVTLWRTDVDDRTLESWTRLATFLI
jgi:hypothetical protein